MLSSRTEPEIKEYSSFFILLFLSWISVTNAVCLHTKNSDQSNRLDDSSSVVGCRFAEKPILDCNHSGLYLQFCSGGESRVG